MAIAVSVIIPCYNDAARLQLCLDAMAEQTFPASDFEVLVVDNGSKEPPKALVEKYGFCRFFQESKPGSYAARNCAIAQAHGATLAYTDSDCLPDREWLARGHAALLAAGKAIVGGKVVIFPRDSQSPNAVELVDMAFGLDQEANVHKTGFSVTANLFAPQQAFDAVGAFNDQLFSGGDHEWCVRAVEGGYPLHFEPAAIVHHPARDTLRASIRQARRIVGGRVDRKTRRNPLTLHFWKTVARVLLPDMGKILRCRRRLAERDYGVWHWLRTIPIILAIQYAKAFEFVRKMAGFTSEKT